MKISIKLAVLLLTCLSFCLSSCKKYEDGPALSLHSKKSRMVNDWRVDKMIQNGIDVSNTISVFYVVYFNEDNTFTTSLGPGDTGTWQFDNKKNDLSLIPTGQTTPSVTYEILRLTNDELWLKQIDGSYVLEYRYVTN